MKNHTTKPYFLYLSYENNDLYPDTSSSVKKWKKYYSIYPSCEDSYGVSKVNGRANLTLINIMRTLTWDLRIKRFIDISKTLTPLLEKNPWYSLNSTQQFHLARSFLQRMCHQLTISINVLLSLIHGLIYRLFIKTIQIFKPILR